MWTSTIQGLCVCVWTTTIQGLGVCVWTTNIPDQGVCVYACGPCVVGESVDLRYERGLHVCVGIGILLFARDWVCMLHV